ncbi:MAG: hypothetical protein BMS9Abin23_0342 [Thermodesulfobacteriota bacterium]|nr:MAG: hypothetical protein BMS9Abin23_0342 [Thermodesulfobacteriota bacterium]
MAKILIILGALLVIEGIPYFAFPEKVKHWALAIQDVDGRSLRIMGFICIAVGLLLLYLIRFF